MLQQSCTILYRKAQRVSAVISESFRESRLLCYKAVLNRVVGPWGYNCRMTFNHYAKIKRILEQQPQGWMIKRINEPTHAQNFKGEVVSFPHYYRVFDCDGEPIKYCKFQQIDRLASVLRLPVEALPLID